MYEGLGCALENLVLAAEAKGYAYKLKLMPNPTNKTHVASISLTTNSKSKNSVNGNKTAASSTITTNGSSMKSDTLSLYNAIPQRHTNRGPYDKNKPVSQDILESLGLLSKTISPQARMTIFWFITSDQRRKVGDLILQATQAIVDDKEQSYDDFKWYRSSWQDIQTNKDGLSVDASGSSWYLGFLAKLLPPISKEEYGSSQVQLAKDTYVATAAAFGIMQYIMYLTIFKD